MILNMWYRTKVIRRPINICVSRHIRDATPGPSSGPLSSVINDQGPGIVNLNLSDCNGSWHLFIQHEATTCIQPSLSGTNNFRMLDQFHMDRRVTTKVHPAIA